MTPKCSLLVQSRVLGSLRITPACFRMATGIHKPVLKTALNVCFQKCATKWCLLMFLIKYRSEIQFLSCSIWHFVNLPPIVSRQSPPAAAPLGNNPILLHVVVPNSYSNMAEIAGHSSLSHWWAKVFGRPSRERGGNLAHYDHIWAKLQLVPSELSFFKMRSRLPTARFTPNVISSNWGTIGRLGELISMLENLIK